MNLIRDSHEYKVTPAVGYPPAIVNVRRADGKADKNTGLTDVKSLKWQIERNIWKEVKEQRNVSV